MSDWFKFYETDLSEARLQWAISQTPESLPVWIALLTEACRHKGGILSGYDKDFEIEALGRMVGVTPEKVVKSIEVLMHIEYLERLGDGSVAIRKWSDRQSNYMVRKARGQIPVVAKPKKSKREAKPKMTDAQWVEAMKKAYPDVNIDREIERGKAWCLTNGRVASRGFLVNWFNRAEKPVRHSPEGPKEF